MKTTVYESAMACFSYNNLSFFLCLTNEQKHVTISYQTMQLLKCS